MLKVLFASVGAVCAVYGLAYISPTNLFLPISMMIFGTLFMLIARALSTSKFGRSAVVAVTNVFSALNCRKYFLEKKIVNLNPRDNKQYTIWIIQSTDCSITPDQDRLYSVKCVIIAVLLFTKAKIKAISNIEFLDLLRSRGQWAKKDSLEVFYGESTSSGFIFTILVLLKNLLVGILIMSDPPLVTSLIKVSSLQIIHLQVIIQL